MKRRKGQVALYLLAVIIAVAVLALMNVDVFLATRTKRRAETGGDAAALAAARRQGALINEIGELNLAHVKAALACNTAECVRIVLAQRRLALLGPLNAVGDASDAALRNGIPRAVRNGEMLSDHAMHVRSSYAGGSGDIADPYPESYPGAWNEYAAALDDAARYGGADGLCARPGNAEFHDAAASHVLLRRAFYHAIASEDWCWFLFNDEALLRDCGSYRDFAPLAPDGSADRLINSEFFSLHLRVRNAAMTEFFTHGELEELLRRAGVRRMPEGPFSPETMGLLADRGQEWFFFDPSHWGTWFYGNRLADGQSDVAFPIVGSVKPLYNVRGCAAVCTVSLGTDFSLAEGVDCTHWSAAAKPFGTVTDLSGAEGRVTAAKGFVLPCMTDVRLVSVDAAGAENLASADFDWLEHVRNHLARYLESGPHLAGSVGCWYCQQLMTWEKPSFHQRGMRWLKRHSCECIRPTGGQYIGRGGTSHGH